MNLFKLMENRRYYYWILLLALVPRILWSVAVPVIPLADSYAYDVFAQNLVNCQNYGWTCHEPSAYWPVGTSFIYSLFYQVFGHSYGPIVIFHILVALVTIGLTMVLADRWFGRQVAALAGVFMAIWPSQVQMTTILASEPIFNALVVVVLVIWLNNNWNLLARGAIGGVLLAGTCYVRPTALLIPILLLFSSYIDTRQIKRSLVSTGIMLTLMGILIAPWSLRNYNAFGEFVLISTNGGSNFWMGNNPESTGAAMLLPSDTNDMNEAERDRYLNEKAKAYIKEKPILFVRNFFRRIFDTHSRESISVVWNEDGLISRYGKSIIMPLKLLNLIYWVFMLALGLLGIFLLVAQSGFLSTIAHPPVLFWFYYVIVHGITVSQDRYHFPSIPMIAILAAFATFFLIKKFAGRFHRIG
jgi:4-amino-4-deoxy-L-arabinose transferase-like glycosyltransferase